MKKYTVQEITEILKLHSEWLNDQNKGKRADLSSADLHWANLSSANLRSANLSWANLRSANLSSANLRLADLSSANLSSADLHWADLSSADLSLADLSSANLSSADLSLADLSLANLRSANLRSANLDDKIISIARIGSCKDITHYNFTKDIIFCGCWKGTLLEFIKRVKEIYKENPQYLKEYLAAIKFFKSLR